MPTLPYQPHFNPRTPWGCDHGRFRPGTWWAGFQSTHPVGGATARAKLRRLALAFQSTHPVGGATRHFALSLQGAKISIHAPLTGCDASHCSGLYRPSHFNPRTPHGVRPAEFAPVGPDGDFNPRTPHGVRLYPNVEVFKRILFQSTHPVGGCDHFAGRTEKVVTLFQSTHPVGGATASPRTCPTRREFQSTHPVGGCDPSPWPSGPRRTDFNPRTPHGVRPFRKRGPCWRGAYFNPRTPHGVRPDTSFFRTGPQTDFNPRTPHGVRLCLVYILVRPTNFNPRTPHGVRRYRSSQITAAEDFNPRTPHGVRLFSLLSSGMALIISIHAPLTGCDAGRSPVFPGRQISIHAPLTGCDATGMVLREAATDFNPRTPHGVRLRRWGWSAPP